MLKRSLGAVAVIGAGMLAALFASCDGHPPPSDTDSELFRSPQQLTSARELNLAKRIADFYRANTRLPVGVSELPPLPAGENLDPPDNPLNDGWGRPILLSAVGDGFELRSYGQDGVQGTPDDVVYRVVHPDSIR